MQRRLSAGSARPERRARSGGRRRYGKSAGDGNGGGPCTLTAFGGHHGGILVELGRPDGLARAMMTTKARALAYEVQTNAIGQKLCSSVPPTSEVNVDARVRSGQSDGKGEEDARGSARLRTKSSNGASAPNVRMKYLGKVASRWRNVARVPSATIRESTSNRQKDESP